MKKTVIDKIAAEILGIDMLESQNCDDLDFWEVSVWSLKEALEAAYAAGKEEGGK